MESHVHRNNSKIAVIKLQSRNVIPLHCSKFEAYSSSMNFCSHHPSGITVDIVRNPMHIRTGSETTRYWYYPTTPTEQVKWQGNIDIVVKTLMPPSRPDVV